MKTNWPMLLYVAFIIALIGGGIFVGIIKFMAWWNIATEGCASV